MDEHSELLAGPLYRFLLRITGDREWAADLAQETLLRAWRRRGSLRREAARKVWLFRIGANLYKDQLARRRRRGAEVAWEDQPDGRPSPPRAAEQQETAEAIAAAMDRLPPRQRQVMHLRAVEELTPAEIADVLGLTPGAVRSSLALARRQLRALLPDLAAQCEARSGAKPRDERRDAEHARESP